MLRSMLHEPTSTSGALVDKQLGLGAGWVCHKGAFGDCLPIWNETKDVGLLFAGESFEDESTIAALRANGHTFKTGDASYLVHLYEELGSHFFEKLNGVFSGLIIDLRENKAILFNDRYGLGRIYYHKAKDGFYFASEAKALLRVLPTLRDLDTSGFAEWFSLGCVLQNRTLFKGVGVLPAASAWTFKPGREVTRQTYFSKESWENQQPFSPAVYYEKLKETIGRIMPRYFRNARRMAMSLTGGLDSRVIMAWARPTPNSLPCYSHRGPFRECADAHIASRVAKVCHQPHHTIAVDGRFLREFPTLAAQTVHITDGTLDVSASAGLFVNRIARDEIAPVRMTGNYGSEILRRLVAFKPRSLSGSWFNAEFEADVKSAAGVYATERQGNDLSFIAFKQVPWHHFSRFALEQSQLTIRSPYLDNDLVSVAFQAPTDLRTNRLLAARLIADGNPALAEFPTDRGPLGRRGPMGRIREEFQEFTFKAEYAFDYGMPDWMAKVDRVLTPFHLERVFLGRHKYCHFRYWYRHQLASYVKEVLLDSRSLSRPYLNKERVTQMVQAHVSGGGNYTSEIHLLLSSELLQRQLIEQQ